MVAGAVRHQGEVGGLPDGLPASDPLVLAAGGTSLTASHQTGAYISQVTWGLPYGDPGSTFQASGGGFSGLFA
jgi:subtilase family serine protease